jgi:dUTP pyrophosphatase
VVVPIARLPGTEDLPAPAYATPGAAGADLHAAVQAPVTVRMGEIVLIPTGLRMAIPPGYEGQIRARSGLALRRGLALVNAPGTIDADYRGEIQVIVTCLSIHPCVIERGERIAQIVITPVAQAAFPVAGALDETERGTRGFGSSGIALSAAQG